MSDPSNDLRLRLHGKLLSSVARGAVATGRGLATGNGLVGRRELLQKIDQLEAELAALRGAASKAPARPATAHPAKARPVALLPAPSRTPLSDELTRLRGGERTSFYRRNRAALARERQRNA